MKILALSGGGFRATLFQLGAIRYLYEQNKLKDIDYVCSVSGGSILAAHMMCHWGDYSDKERENFSAPADKLIAFIRRDVRRRVLRRWLIYVLILPILLIGMLATIGTLLWWWLWPRDALYQLSWQKESWLLFAAAAMSVLVLMVTLKWIYPLIALLQKEYGSLFPKNRFRERKLSELPDRPVLHLLTTSLTNGGLGCFSKQGFQWLDRSGNPFAECDHQGISFAVAASSAFPALFEPVRLDVPENNVRVPHHFTDGGVYDNLGIRAAKNWSEKEEQGLDELWVIDAQRPSDWSINDRYFWLPWRANRVSDVMMEQVAAFNVDSLKNLRGKHRHIKLADQIDNQLSPGVRQSIQRVRTDLDAFSWREIQALVYQGYSAAMRGDLAAKERADLDAKFQAKLKSIQAALEKEVEDNLKKWIDGRPVAAQAKLNEETKDQMEKAAKVRFVEEARQRFEQAKVTIEEEAQKEWIKTQPGIDKKAKGTLDDTFVLTEGFPFPSNKSWLPYPKEPWWQTTWDGVHRSLGRLPTLEKVFESSQQSRLANPWSLLRDGFVWFTLIVVVVAGLLIHTTFAMVFPGAGPTTVAVESVEVIGSFDNIDWFKDNEWLRLLPPEKSYIVRFRPTVGQGFRFRGELDPALPLRNVYGVIVRKEKNEYEVAPLRTQRSNHSLTVDVRFCDLQDVLALVLVVDDPGLNVENLRKSVKAVEVVK